MQVAHLENLIELEEHYWWHVAKRELVLSLLAEYAPPPGKLVEGGVGSARNLLAFQEKGYDVSGFDCMQESVAYAQHRGLSVSLHDLATPWPVMKDSVRAVVLLDVIEHIADPVAVLTHVREVLAPGGAAVITVPAYQWLFGDWDTALGHYRRYTCGLLRSQAEEAGLKVLRLSHWNAFTLPAAVAVRGVQKLRPAERAAEFPAVSGFTNRLLLGCAAAERWMLQHVGVPCGLSVVGVFSK
ncbi:class I SAM-dependent methyltransferase [Planctomicrobium piriforme]|uniref:Methyltransferase domain-containing protein n=1 Tax=Planctomicrobium piriforme TaxID=1576369 RepID=A0A1I3FTS7_9PLAN|nr:class I SAM-dependent methyltransferase [Planctomicrobium piriforme]SFI14341.1 Methyltransferase domain-containing protein [Planctomicrobium piriforme]